MLSRLSIQGLAIIDRLEIEWGPGFNVITGETGAGKSILIKGLSLLLGAKASPDTVRQGCNEAVLSGGFWVPEVHPAVGVLESLGIPREREGGHVSILFRREISSKGRSQFWINDTSVSSHGLRQVAVTLVDIFGQHENQRLLQTSTHLSYLDRFLPDKKLRAEVGEAFVRCGQLLSEIRDITESWGERAKEKDYLEFRLKALQELDPSREDFEKTRAQATSADSREKVLSLLEQLTQVLDGNDSDSISRRLAEATKVLTQLALTWSEVSADFSDVTGRLAREVEELSYQVGRWSAEWEDLAEGSEESQGRLFKYQEQFRKLGIRDIDALLAAYEELQEKLSNLGTGEERLAEKLHELVKESANLIKLGERLSTVRKVAAQAVETKVALELSELAMPQARLAVVFHPVEKEIAEISCTLEEPSEKLWRVCQRRLAKVEESGLERGEFLLSSNPGEPLLPLARVASGGEVSRIMLSLKKALVADADTCVLVFDEIDTGISGRVADVVGRKLRELAETFQVICISHLPQVAVYADSHFLVRKGVSGGRTESEIIALSEEESAKEIARLVSGAEVSSTSLAHAKALKQTARSQGGAAAKGAKTKGKAKRPDPAGDQHQRRRGKGESLSR